MFYYHVPVLLKESVEGLNVCDGGVYVDATFGCGGHSKKILSELNNEGHLYGFDQDEYSEKNIIYDKKFTFVRGNFRYLIHFMDWYNVKKINGLIVDLGVSSVHFDDYKRGFSFRFVGMLDMRMNQRSGQTASDILNTYSEKQLNNVFRLYGELKNSHFIAYAVVKARRLKKIYTIQDFLNIINPFIIVKTKKKQLSQIFQALRIEVNKELDSLKELLIQAKDLLKLNGRIVVITYHSLEDRLVKTFFKTGNFDGKIDKDFYGNVSSTFKIINRKVIVPCNEEIMKNPRSRSAKLRIAEKI
ncbi:MAG: 16S rRNA (cytosine(1402)-N(4))-methyltransferase RsmH [Bacteroidales bacterium OttesenSCG-928-I14]|jgi:16S rRNA (cytosine1402-N4)-methyltransferase|nr:16S rRNA (cytosine(1402)-N(4))-methyltransferase RsmH [Bacteroidales bacterium OttesenSCG-928-I14]